MPPFWQIALIWYTVLNASCFVAYWLDKRRAVKGGVRIPEARLHTLELLGGWPAAYLAAARFRHKTKKLSYRVKRFAMAILNVILLGAGVYAWITMRA